MSETITVTINGLEIETRKGRLLIDVADEHDIVIPRFCYHKKLSVAANCRMCLVEIEKSPKPMPACATQCMDGMVVRTRSRDAIAAQKSTMEFLLINHPLDCPICDQGGECELQDVAMGFGEGVSKYTEQKRVVMDKNIGPLIATDLTRCIHCTRCVRFGDEIAGMPELGATGRGEHMEIGTYVGKAIVSEMSGNMIDVCPVGALTAKPSRYSYRPWDLRQHAGVSPHDCVGSNLYWHSFQNRIMRVVPRDNESINECWIADRDRFSYTALRSDARITQPLLRESGGLKPVDWETALDAAAERLGTAGSGLATLVSPQATLEEMYLAQKLTRALGSKHIDHRLTQVDFSTQDKAPIMPWLGRSLASVESLDAALLVGGNLRFEQPLLSHRLRKAALHNSAAISSITHFGGRYNFPLRAELTGSAEQLVLDLAAIAVASGEVSGRGLEGHLANLLRQCEVSETHLAIARSLVEGQQAAVIVGVQTLANPHLGMIQELCEAITERAGATLGYLSPGANSAGACLAGVTPHRGPAGVALAETGEHAAAILASSHPLLLTLGVNPPLDTNSTAQLSDNNEGVIAISAFDSDFLQQQADLVLPLAGIAETDGSYVNVEGLWQSFRAAVAPRDESRSGWEILRALGERLRPGEFDYPDANSIRDELKQLCGEVRLSSLQGIESRAKTLPRVEASLQKVGIAPLYAVDDMTRLSPPLQATPLMRQQSSAMVNRATAEAAKLLDCKQVQIRQDNGSAVLPLVIDEGVPDGCVCLPTGIDAVSHLGEAFGAVKLEKLA